MYPITSILNEKSRALKPYAPVDQDVVINLDANESFLSLTEEMKGKIFCAINDLNLNRYPDPMAKDLIEAFAKLHSLPLERVVAGNGSDEIIGIIFQIFLQKGDAFATIQPDFSMYQFYGHLAEVRHVIVPKGDGFEIDPSRVIDKCNEEGVNLLIFSNPCNPTSVGLSRGDVLKIIEGVNALVIVDEAYMEFWKMEESLLSDIDRYDNLLLLKTCSKARGLAGIRLGFAIGNQKLIQLIQAAKSPYNVNSITQTVGKVVLSETRAMQEALDTILKSRDDLFKEVKMLAKAHESRLKVLQTKTNFVSLVVEHPQKLYDFLLSSGIAVRVVSGLIRITCGTKEENAAVIKALTAYFIEV